MASLGKRKELAAVSREASENTNNSQSQNTVDPEMAQEFIHQVFEKFYDRVTKKLSKDFIRMESRILGALSILDEFILNAQVRTCSLAAPGTSRNNDSENREPTGDRSWAIPVSKWCSLPTNLVIWTIRSKKRRIIWWQELKKRFASVLTKFKNRLPTAPLELHQENIRRCALHVSHNFTAISLAPQQLASNSNSANFRNNVNRISKSRTCPNPSQRQCPPLTGTQKNWTVWRSDPNKFEKSQSAYRRRQNKLLPLSNAWGRTTNNQKHSQPQQREFSRNFDCVP